MHFEKTDKIIVIIHQRMAYIQQQDLLYVRIAMLLDDFAYVKMKIGIHQLIHFNYQMVITDLRFFSFCKKFIHPTEKIILRQVRNLSWLDLSAIM